ncbi:chloride channel protein, putative, partial [Bodo saltans]
MPQPGESQYLAAPRRGNTGRQASDSADDIVSDITREEDDRSPVYSDYGSSRMTREDSNENTGVRFTESFPRTPQQQRGPTSSAARLRRRRSAIDIEILAEKARLPALPAVNPGKEPRRFTETELDKMQRYESLDTFIPQTTMHKDHLEYRSREPRWFIWVFVLVVGVLTAAVAVLMVSCIHMLFA